MLPILALLISLCLPAVASAEMDTLPNAPGAARNATSAEPSVNASTDLAILAIRTAGPHLDALHRTPDEVASMAAIADSITGFIAPEVFEAQPGGAAMVLVRLSSDAVSQRSGNMPFDRQLDF